MTLVNRDYLIFSEFRREKNTKSVQIAKGEKNCSSNVICTMHMLG